MKSCSEYYADCAEMYIHFYRVMIGIRLQLIESECHLAQLLTVAGLSADGVCSPRS